LTPLAERPNFRPVRRAPSIVLVLSMALAGCAIGPPPSETQPLAAPRGDTRIRVAFCYRGDVTTATDLMAMARATCADGATPRLLMDRLSPSACPLLTPWRVTFACQGARP